MAARKSKPRAKRGPKTKSKAKAIPRGTALIVLDAKGNVYYTPPGSFMRRVNNTFSTSVAEYEEKNREQIAEAGRNVRGFVIENADAWRAFGGMDTACVVPKPKK